MKKILLILFLFFLFHQISFSLEISNPSKGITVYQAISNGNFSMHGRWYCADTFSMSAAGTVLSSAEYEIEPYFFKEFDYIPNTKIDILERVHPQNTYSVPSEGDAVFQVKYCDAYENSMSNEYPKLILTHPDSSTHTYTMTAGTDGVFLLTENLLKGIYKYEYIATNEHYIYNNGSFSLSGEWYVTSRPYNFVRIKPIANVDVLPDDAQFQWAISTDEPSDILKYEFYIGMENDKNKLKKVDNGPSINTKSYIHLTSLNHVRQYYWYMRISNKYGADMETDLFSFRTGGQVEKFFNAPNPFNPARGQQTKFVFNMPQSGSAKIIIYSEYGDKVWESDTYNFAGDTVSSKEITYAGKDNSGKTLYNGSYLAILTKKHSGTTKVEKCRILIIK